MIHKKAFKFTYQDTVFEATVTYEDMEFGERFKKPLSIYYRVQLHEPLELNCGGAFAGEAKGFAMQTLLQPEIKKNRFGFIEDESIRKEGTLINVYPLAVEKILYRYFNKKEITYYEQKVQCFEEAIDAKYMHELKRVDEEKKELKEKMKSRQIDPKEYQKLYTPIRIESETLSTEQTRRKSKFKDHYFKCCELKVKYRSFVSSKTTNCYDPYNTCMFLKHVSKTVHKIIR